MVGKNATRLVGWHPPKPLVTRLDEHIRQRGGGRGVQTEILNQMLAEWLDRNENDGKSGAP